MKTHKKNSTKVAGALAVTSLALCVVDACISVWGQPAPGLRIASTGTNLVTITVTNGLSNGLYQIYYREFLNTNYPWTYLTNGALGQTNFTADISDTLSGYFQAAYNTNFVTPTIIVIIQAPTNGSLIY